MRPSLLVGLWAALVAGLARIEYCANKCTIDSNCADSIHDNQLGNAKCCGGTCALVDYFPRDKLLGQSCNVDTGLIDNYESCGGYCVGGLFCGGDRKCHPQLGLGCNCTDNSQCASNYCNSTGSCQGFAACAYCTLGTQCQSGICSSLYYMCAGIAPGQQCQPGYEGLCASGYACLINYTVSQFQCTTACQLGVPGCCTYDWDCAGGFATPGNPITATCSSGTCKPVPGLNEACSSYCNPPSLLCASACNATVGSACATTYVCQQPNMFLLGAACQQDQQCPVNTTCSNGICTEPFTIPLGGPCNTVSDCAPPGNICSSNILGGGTICKMAGTTLIGVGCVTSTPTECEYPSQCLRNASGIYQCQLPLPLGTACLSMKRSAPCDGDPYSSYDYDPLCQGPTTGKCRTLANGCTCIAPYSSPVGGLCTGDLNCQQNASCVNIFNFNNGYKTCVLPHVVPTGGDCNYTFQCKDLNALCYAPNRTCVVPTGLPCGDVSDCNFGFSSLYPQYDCSCDRVCYLLNPAQPPTVPPPTAAPSPPIITPCQQKAIDFANANPYYTGYTPSGYIGQNEFFVKLLPTLQTLPNNATLKMLIDMACCGTCAYPLNFAYYSYPGNYFLDCAAKTINTVSANQCSLSMGSLAFTNCWSLTSPASTATLGLGSLVAVFAFIWM